MKIASLILFLSFYAQGALPVGAKDLNGKPISFDPHKNTVLLFISSHCDCSLSHESKIAKIAQDFSDFTFVGVNSNPGETIQAIKEHYSKTEIKFPFIKDESQKLADEFKAFKTPHVFVLSPQGEVLYQGGVDDSSNADKAKTEYLRNALTDLRAGRKPAVSETRALGCVISRKKG